MKYHLSHLTIHGTEAQMHALASRYGDGGGYLLRGYTWGPDVVYQDLERWDGHCLAINIGTHATANPYRVVASLAAAYPELRICAEIYQASQMPPIWWADGSLAVIDHAIYIGGRRHYPEDDVEQLHACINR